MQKKIVPSEGWIQLVCKKQASDTQGVKVRKVEDLAQVKAEEIKKPRKIRTKKADIVGESVEAKAPKEEKPEVVVQCRITYNDGEEKVIRATSLLDARVLAKELVSGEKSHNWAGTARRVEIVAGKKQEVITREEYLKNLPSPSMDQVVPSRKRGQFYKFQSYNRSTLWSKAVQTRVTFSQG